MRLALERHRQSRAATQPLQLELLLHAGAEYRWCLLSATAVWTGDACERMVRAFRRRAGSDGRLLTRECVYVWVMMADGW